MPPPPPPFCICVEIAELQEVKIFPLIACKLQLRFSLKSVLKNNEKTYRARVWRVITLESGKKTPRPETDSFSLHNIFTRIAEKVTRRG